MKMLSAFCGFFGFVLGCFLFILTGRFYFRGVWSSDFGSLFYSLWWIPEPWWYKEPDAVSHCSSRLFAAAPEGH